MHYHIKNKPLTMREIHLLLIEDKEDFNTSYLDQEIDDYDEDYFYSLDFELDDEYLELDDYYLEDWVEGDLCKLIW